MLNVAIFPSFIPVLPFPGEFPAHAGSSGRRKKTNPSPGAHKANRRKRQPRPGNRVLLFGRIRELALYRAEVLQNQGYTVSTPHTKEESVAAIRRGNFDVAILTYTLSSETVQELAELIREYCPDSRIIAISNSDKEDREINPDAIALADDGPPALLAALRKVTRRT